MSCRCRTTVLRIPASRLGFTYRREFDAFLNEHEEDFNWEPGYFAESLSDQYPEYFPGATEYYSRDPGRRLDLKDPLHPEMASGPFLDYYLDQIEPLPDDQITYGENDIARELTEEEKEEYLEIFLDLFPDFTAERMNDVHYCEYEWYNGSDAPYMY